MLLLDVLALGLLAPNLLVLVVANVNTLWEGNNYYRANSPTRAQKSPMTFTPVVVVTYLSGYVVNNSTPKRFKLEGGDVSHPLTNSLNTRVKMFVWA